MAVPSCSKSLGTLNLLNSDFVHHWNRLGVVAAANSKKLRRLSRLRSQYLLGKVLKASGPRLLALFIPSSFPSNVPTLGFIPSELTAGLRSTPCLSFDSQSRKNLEMCSSLARIQSTLRPIRLFEKHATAAPRLGCRRRLSSPGPLH
jgi:hypothetical protein